MLGSSLFLVAACAFNAVYGYGGNECQTDDCLKAVIGTRSQPCLYRCKSFMKATVTPTPTTVYATVTEAATEHTTTGVIKTDTNYITVTSTKSETVTVTSGITRTQFTSKTATQTITTTVTSQDYVEPIRVEYKRDALAEAHALARLKGKAKKNVKRTGDEPSTRYPTCMATKIVSACSNTAAYSSACSCVGVTATTVTKSRATVTKTTTVTQGTGVVHQSTSTTTKLITDSTTYQTVKSSTTVLVTVGTVTSETVVGTVTKTVTTTVARSASSSTSSSASSSSSSSAPPVSTPGVTLEMVIQSSPNSVQRLFNDLDDQSFPYMGFRNEPEAQAKELRWDVNPQNGRLTLVSARNLNSDLERDLVGESLYYLPDGVGSSYAFVAWPEYAAELDAKPVSCSVVGSGDARRLSCKYNSQTADIWICAGDLKLTRPNYDLPNEDPECEGFAYMGTINVKE